MDRSPVIATLKAFLDQTASEVAREQAETVLRKPTQVTCADASTGVRWHNLHAV